MYQKYLEYKKKYHNLKQKGGFLCKKEKEQIKQLEKEFNDRKKITKELEKFVKKSADKIPKLESTIIKKDNLLKQTQEELQQKESLLKQTQKVLQAKENKEKQKEKQFDSAAKIQGLIRGNQIRKLGYMNEDVNSEVKKKKKYVKNFCSKYECNKNESIKTCLKKKINGNRTGLSNTWKKMENENKYEDPDFKWYIEKLGQENKELKEINDVISNISDQNCNPEKLDESKIRKIIPKEKKERKEMETKKVKQFSVFPINVKKMKLLVIVILDLEMKIPNNTIIN